MLKKYLKDKFFPAKLEREKKRLAKRSRYQPGYSSLAGGLYYTDPGSLLAGYHEIFEKQNYLFTTPSPRPFIIDCGANIGLSLVYFKQLFPSAEIIGIEPDPEIFAVLKKNTENRNYENVTLVNKAVYPRETVLSFQPEGGFSGRISKEAGHGSVRVETISLESLIADRPVDFLKIDVEGAEHDILLASEHCLKQVSNLFVEYHSESGEKQNLGNLLSVLERSGFRYQLKESYASARPFIGQPLQMNMDFQTDIFAFRDVNPVN